MMNDADRKNLIAGVEMMRRALPAVPVPVGGKGKASTIACTQGLRQAALGLAELLMECEDGQLVSDEHWEGARRAMFVIVALRDLLGLRAESPFAVDWVAAAESPAAGLGDAAEVLAELRAAKAAARCP